MKKIISVLLATVICFSSVCAFATYIEPEKIYLFVQEGAQNGDGSKEKPFATFEEARDKIREIKKNGDYPDGGVVVYFREGNYKITKFVNLTDEDSGTETGPVVYRAYMNEKPVFVGGVSLPVNKFKKVSDSEVLKRLNESAKDEILCVNLKQEFGLTDYGELNMFGMGVGYFTASVAKMEENGVNIPTEQPPEVFFDDAPGIIARYPNEGYLKIDYVIDAGDDIQRWSHTYVTREGYVPYEERVYPPKPSVFKIDDDTTQRIQKWVNEDDVWVFGYFSVNWSDISLPVRKLDYEKGIITTKYPSPIVMKGNTNYYIYNVLGELDTPGEYYLDRNTGNLYIYPTDMNGTITFSNLNENFLCITGASNIRFKGLSFKGTRKNAIELWGCNDVDFELCTISKSAKMGINSKNCMNCNFTSCHIYHTGTGGIDISTSATNDKSRGADVYLECDQNLTPQNNIVENCEIHEFSRIRATYSPAVNLGGVGNTVRNCKIYDADHYAITPEGNDVLVEYNEFTELLKTSDDSGVLYSGFAKEKRGVVVRNNYFHDIYSSTSSGRDISMLYPDDTNSGWTASQNLFVNIGGRTLHSNGGDNHTVTDNIAINLGGQFLNFGAHETDLDGKYAWERYSFPKYLDNPAYAKYKNFADITVDNYLQVKDIYTDRNIIWNVAGGDITGKAYTDYADTNNINPSYEIKADPGFVDMENGDYTLRKDSIIYRKYPDFNAPDFNNMGIYTDKLGKLLDTNISFLDGSPKTYNEFEADEVNPRHDAAPVIIDGVAHLPLRYITETLGGEVSYNEETEEITLYYLSHIIIIKPEEYFTVNGTSLLPAERISELFDMKIKVYDNGVIIMGEEIKIDDETNLINELYRRLDNE